MAFPILGSPKPAFTDSNGSPLASGTLSILEPTDDTNKTYYPTADDADAATNGSSGDITLDSRGETPNALFGVSGEKYKIVLKDSSGTTIYTVDDVQVVVAGVFNNSGVKVVGHRASGINVYDASGNNPVIGFFQDDQTTENAYIQANSTTGLIIRNEVHGAPVAIESENNAGTPVSIASFDPDTGITMLLPVFFDGTPQTLTGAGAVNLTTSVTHIVTTGANALTLADGTTGQVKYIVMKTDAGAGTLTPTNLANGTTITFDDVGDSAQLLFTNSAWHFMGGTATLA